MNKGIDLLTTKIEEWSNERNLNTSDPAKQTINSVKNSESYAKVLPKITETK